MALALPFKHCALATMAGTAARPNEDYAAAGPDWAVVLDGATHFDGVDTGCIHDVPWLVGHLAAALVEQLILGPVSLPETLAVAIEATCSAHAGTCDLANPDSPSSAVALVRSTGTAIEYLVLGDSPVILQTGNGITPVVDDRVDHLQPGGRPYTRTWSVPSAMHPADSGWRAPTPKRRTKRYGASSMMSRMWHCLRMALPGWSNITVIAGRTYSSDSAETARRDLSGACGKLSAIARRPCTGTASSTMMRLRCISK